MVFGFTPVAEANISTLMNSVDKVIINPIIFFLFALALAYFLYGVAQYLLNPDNEEINKKSKSQMLSGIIGLFIMVAVFGIMHLILNTLGENRIKLQNNGNYEVANKGSSTSTNFDVVGNKLNPLKGEITSNNIDLRSAKNNNLTNIKMPTVSDYNKSPFRVIYIDNSRCWHKDIEATGKTEYEAKQQLKMNVNDKYTTATGINPPLNKNPNTKGTVTLISAIKNFGILTAYNPNNATYYSWMDARAPIKVKGGTENDCILAVDTAKTKEVSLKDLVPNSFSVSTDVSNGPTNVSNGPSIFTTNYTSDDLYTRVVASGANPVLALARDIAIRNAYLLLYGKKVKVNNMTIVFPTATIIKEKYVYDHRTGDYNYWVAIQSKKRTDNNTVTKCQNFPPPSFCPSGISDVIVTGTDSNGCATYSCKTSITNTGTAPAQ